MTVTKYLQNKYGMSGKTKIPTDFILIETLITRKYLTKTLPKMLDLKTVPVRMSFGKFCKIIETYLESPCNDAN